MPKKLIKKDELNQYKHTNKIQALRITELELALKYISMMGAGLKMDVIDWGNIGKNAVYKAREAISPKCRTCGNKIGDSA